MTDPRIDAVIRHDMQNQWGLRFDEWKERRPRQYEIRAADAGRWLAAADAADPVRRAFADFVFYLSNKLDEDAQQHPIGREEIDAVLNRCEALTEEFDL